MPIKSRKLEVPVGPEGVLSSGEFYPRWIDMGSMDHIIIQGIGQLRLYAPQVPLPDPAGNPVPTSGNTVFLRNQAGDIMQLNFGTTGTITFPEHLPGFVAIGCVDAGGGTLEKFWKTRSIG